jgi:hypothetical protein
VLVPAVVIVAGIVLASSAGATGPPTYLGAFGHPSPCPGPNAAERRDVLAVAKRAAVGEPRPSVNRILLVGDSIACSLYPGLWAVGREGGVTVDQGAVVGCGIVSDDVTPTGGEAVMAGSDTCHDLVAYTEAKAIERARPDVVVWFSSWERFNLRVGNRIVRSGTPRADALLLSRMDDAFSRLTAPRARLVIVTLPLFTRGSALGLQIASSPRRDAEVAHLNALLRRFAARHQSRTSIIDLGRHVCPDGAPCAPEVDGRRPRPDGSHFDGPGAVWAAEWFFRRLPR